MRNTAVDALRGVAILAVVGLHVTYDAVMSEPRLDANGRLMLALHVMTGFGVPAFIAASAISLCYRYPSGFSGPNEYGRFLARRCGKLLPGYVFWSLVSAALLQPGLVQRPGRVFWLLVTGSADGHLYFVPLIFQLYIAWPLMCRLTPVFGGRHRAAAAAAAAMVIWAMPWQPAFLLAANRAPWSMGPFWITFAFVGIAISAVSSRGVVSIPERSAVVVSGALVVVGYVIDFGDASLRFANATDPFGASLAITVMRASVILYSAATVAYLYSSVLRRETTASFALGWLAALGQRSYGVFLIHLLILRFAVAPVLNGIRTHADPLGEPIHACASWLLCIAFSVGIVETLARVPLVRRLVGVSATVPPTR